MIDLDTWQEIFDSLRRHKLRTALTAFGVFWGIFMLIVLLAVGKGLQNGVYSQFGNTATNAVYIWGGKTTLPFQGMNPGRWVQLTNKDLEAIRAGVGGIAYLNANMSLWGEFTILNGTREGSFKVDGDLPDVRFIQPRFVTAGRFLDALDVRESRKTAVIGQKVKDTLFQDENPVGKYLKIKGVYFLIVGVFDINRIGGQSTDMTSTIHIPLTTLQKVFAQGDYVGSFGLCPLPGYSAAALERQICDLLKVRHKVSPDDQEGIGTWNTEKQFQSFQGLFKGISAFMWVVGLGTLIAGIVGVSNIMLIIVKERTREIGIRKAIGASPRSIIVMIVQESVFLTSVSGLFGLVGGIGAIELVNFCMNKFNIHSDYFKDPRVDLSVAVAAVLLLVASGTVAGLIPGRKASMIISIEALRSE